ncbi:MAG: hypothetical protein RDV48_10005 [Candidatus Eremiobacteraeota bacterium]|nr:hypothetical protein [Candidatus Eremiobacteraeota bacterium]
MSDMISFNPNMNVSPLTPRQMPLQQKSSENFVTEWQQPLGDQLEVNFKTPPEIKLPSKPAEKKAEPEKPSEQFVTDWQMPAAKKGPDMVSADTLTGIGQAGKEQNGNTTGRIFIDDTPPLQGLDLPWEFPAPAPLKDIGQITLTAGPGTAFFNTGLNSISSSLKDGIYFLDGEKF